MACLNINSLLGHIDQLRLFLSTNEKTDILVINETKLDQTVHDNEIYLPGFDVVRRDRITNGRNGGGVSMYLRSNLCFHVRDDLSSSNLESLIIEITKPRSKPFLVGTWYRPPQSSPDLFAQFETLVGKIDAENKEFYLLGDLNCNLLPEHLDSNSSQLLNIMEIYGLSQLINEPTRITQNSRTLIDLCLTNSPGKVSRSGVVQVGISDHSLVYMTRKSRQMRSGIHKTSVIRNFKHFNSADFLHDLKQLQWNDVSIHKDPNEMWNVWKDHFMSAIDKHAPSKTKRISTKKSPWITRDLITKMHKRDFLKRNHSKTNDPKSWEDYKKARNDVNSSIKLAKRRYFTDNLEANTKDPRKTWKLINELQNRQRKVTNISEIKVDNRSLSSAPEITEAFNSHFANIGQELACEISETDVNVLSYLKPVQNKFILRTTDVQTVIDLIKKIDGKKATGLDRIPCRLLKSAVDVVAPSLTEIFNQSISRGVFPMEWKLARVTPVFKKGSKSDVNNYRPISVIPIVAKIFEKIVYDQLYRYLNSNNLLTNCQSGFRSLHSTLTALLETANSWNVNIDKGFLNGVIFIDLKKAFDTIDHEIVIQKLESYGIRDNELKWFKSYLSDRSQKCFTNGHLSSLRPVTCGVPQGSILGPLLFLIYINDLPNCLSEGIPRMYADDTTISYAASTLSNIQTQLNLELKNINIWLRSNKLSLNVAKTEFMVIGSRQRLQNQGDCASTLQVEDKQINKVENTKSLGVYIDDKLSWKTHISKISKKISSGIGALKRVRPFVNQHTATTIYKALIEPHFEYCSSVWDGLSQQLSDKLQKLQNRAARVITCSGYDTSSDLLLKQLGFEKLQVKRSKQKAIMVYKSLNALTPSYLEDLFTIKSAPYIFRDSENKLIIPKPRTDYCKRSFSYSGSVLWNGFPVELRKSSSLSQFKRGLDNFYSKSDSHTANM